MTLVDLALRESGIEREAIDGLVIGLGPGSYTGIRSAIALAQGWQLARPTKLIGLSSAEALAAGAQAGGFLGGIGVVIDAQRGEFYFAGYEITECGRQLTQPLHIATRQAIPALASSYQTFVGPEVRKFFDGGQILFPQAGILGQLTDGKTNSVPAERLEPIYLRETQFVKAPPPRNLAGLR